jgi:hypothetical protein
MAAKAKLTIVLKADETIVAEVENPGLWQRVLGIINQSGPPSGTAAIGLSDPQPDSLSGDSDVALGNDDSIERFSKHLGASVDIVNGAMSPSREPPYLQLNAHNWEAFKKNFPKRGPGSVSPIGLAGTALALWFKDAKIDVPATQALASAVLDTISVKDPNPSRGIKNTKWLQARAGGAIIVNPAEISKAQEIARLYCQKKAMSSAS